MSLFTRNAPVAPPAARTAVDVFDAPTAAVTDISGDYTLDASHSRLGFSVRHAMVTTVRGQFGEFTGTATVDTTTPANSSVSLTIAATSIDTGNADRDGHLASGDFFDTETFPELTFTSTKVERRGVDVWVITGDLSIKGIARSVSIEFESTGSAVDPYGNLRIGFEGSATISRKDWGLTWNAALETGGVLVSEKVKLDFDISAIRNA